MDFLYSQETLTTLDWILRAIIAHPLSDEKLGLKGSIIKTIILVILYIGGILISLKFPPLRRFLNNSPITIVQNGEILYKGLKKARISINILLEELRKEKVDDVKKVALATFNFPKTIIKEGKLDLNELKELHKDGAWIVSQLGSLYQTKIKNVLIATLDNKDNLNVFLYK